MTDPELSPGWTPPPGTPLVTQADRWGWQRKAVRALADILDANPDLPQIAWTIGPTGALAGQVNGLAPAEEVRAAFLAWQLALRLENVREVPIRDTGVTSLSGKVYYGTVQVAILARVFGPFPDDVEAVGTPEAGSQHAPENRVAARPQICHWRVGGGVRRLRARIVFRPGHLSRPGLRRDRSPRSACKAGDDARAAPPPCPDRRQRTMVEVHGPRGPG